MFQHPVTHQIDQRLNQLPTTDHPVGQGAPGQIDTGAGQNAVLPVQRQTIQFLAAMMSRLLYVAVRTPPMPGRLLKLAEVHW